MYPAPFDLLSWGKKTDRFDLEATQQALVELNERWLDPLASLLGSWLGQQEDVGIGLTVSGSLVHQWEHWAYDSLDAWQQVWKNHKVEILPQPWQSGPVLLWDREAWIQGLKTYAERLSLLGATLSPVGWHPGYLFLHYLAWPMQQEGIQAALVDGDSFGWHGGGANQVAKLPFQQDFRLLIRNSGWSRSMTSLDGLLSAFSPADLARRWVADLVQAREAPVVIGIDLGEWARHPGKATAILAFLQQLLALGAKAGIRWKSPGDLLKSQEAYADFHATDWVVAPEDRAIIGDAATHPMAAALISTWRDLPAASEWPELLDVCHLRAVDDPEAWLGDHVGKSGHLFGRLMAQFTQMETRREAP